MNYQMMHLTQLRGLSDLCFILYSSFTPGDKIVHFNVIFKKSEFIVVFWVKLACLYPSFKIKEISITRNAL